MTDTVVLPERPRYSPWGALQGCTQFAEGIFSVHTASHGGFMVRVDVAEATFSKPGIEKGDRNDGVWLAYEEDCDWAIVAWERRDLWPQMFKHQREAVSLGASVCQGSYGEGCHRTVTGELDGFGFCKMHESGVRLNRQMATDPEAYLRHTLSAWRTDYLIARGDETEPEGYAYFLKGHNRDRLIREKSPDHTVAAVGVAPGIVKVWTADGKVHYVTAESYGGGGDKANHSLANMVQVEYQES
jgi:hypothetical protein